ncbi:MAG: extracellular solute-binding protein [Planctomycetota bacterium]|nr:MAG: extracellular solute-binding protein [Planctomycetota bacterium]
MLVLAFFVFTVLCCGCTGEQNVVVVFTSLDKEFSAPVLKRFEKETGIKVKAQYDDEAVKTVGLVNRLLQEHKSGQVQCDVFWNSETSRALFLKKRGVTQPYASPSAKDIPAAFKDPKNHWTGFAARARVLVYNTKQLTKDKLPKSIFELTEPQWKDKVGIAEPTAGTTGSHVAALAVVLGREKALDYFRKLAANGCRKYPGNSTVRDRVAQAEVLIGFTDTDDVFAGMAHGKPINQIFPDADGMGTLVIPNTVMLMAGAPNADNGKKLIDWLLRRETEAILAKADSRQIPLREGVTVPEDGVTLGDIKAMKVDISAVSDTLNKIAPVVRDILDKK